MKFDNIIIFSDFDGTFCKAGNIPAINLEKIEYFKANGGHFTLSTGRLPVLLKDVFPDHRNVVNAPMIMGNGSLLYDPEAEKIVEENMIKQSTGMIMLRDVLETFGPRGLLLALFGDNGELLMRPDIDSLTYDSWYKLRFDVTDPVVGTDSRDYVIEKYPGEYNVFRSSFYCTEVVDKSATKAKLLGRVKEILSEKSGIPAEEYVSVCVGDFENDIPMLKAADRAFCPENALREVKDICEKTFCSAGEGCIAEIIDWLDNEVQ